MLEAITLPMLQWPGEIEPFVEWLKERQPRHILEIGTAGGGLAMLFGRVASGLIISVDLPSGSSSGLDLAGCTRRNDALREDNPRFVGILGNSYHPDTVAQVSQVLNGESLSLIFIDGDHHYDAIARDVVMYRPLAQPGGYLAFHDINADKFASDGVDVPRYWRDLKDASKLTWTVNGDWGGIGAVPA